MDRIIFLLRALALAAAMLFASAPAAAESLLRESCIAPLAAGQSAAQVVARPQDFDCTRKQASFGRGDYVVRLRFAPTRSEIADPLVLRIPSVWQDWARIHYSYADGTVKHTTFTSLDNARVLRVGAIFELPVPVHAAPLSEVWVESHGAGNVRGVVIGPRLMKRSESHAHALQATILYAAFAGLALALIVYNLALWATLRHRFQLFYCAMVGGLMGYAFSSSGLISFLVPQLDNNDRLRINYFLLWLTAAMALQFARHFFGGRIVGRAIDRAVLIATAISGAATLAFVALAPWQIHIFDSAYFISVLAMVGLVPPMLLRAWQAKSPYLPMVLLAWSAPLVTTLLRGLNGFGVMEYSFWLDNGNLIALSLEALVSSILVTARLRELSYERDHARAGERDARRLAATDPLTGLLNRRAFLDLAIGRTSRQRLMLIDIDQFKSVNDRLGHAGGDDVLCAVADAIQSCRPARSLAVRLGGEEFALLLPKVSIDECPAERVLQAVRDKAMPQGIAVTISVGYADGTVDSEEDWKRLYRLADAALYRAKADGRDRACRATDFRAAAA